MRDRVGARVADQFGDRLDGDAPGALDFLATVVSRWSGGREHLAAVRAAFQHAHDLRVNQAPTLPGAEPEPLPEIDEMPTCEDCGSDLETGDLDAALCRSCRALNAQAETEAARGATGPCRTRDGTRIEITA